MYRPRTANEWLFVGTATAQAVCTTALDVYVVLAYFDWINPVVYQVPRSYVVPVNFGLFILGNIYQVALVLDALRLKNHLQLYSICVLDFTLLVFSAMRYFQTEDVAARLQVQEALGNKPFTNRSVDYWAKIQLLLLFSIAVVGICTVISCVMVFILQREFRWAIYRHFSGSLQMRRRFLAYQVLLVLIRVEPYFLTGFVLVYGLVNVHYVQPEFGLTMALIPALVILSILTAVFVKRENYLGTIIAIVVRLGEMAYLLSRILILTGKGLMSKTLLKNEMLLFAGVTLALATLACLNTMICAVNFKKGLKPLLEISSWQESPHEFEPVHQHRYAQRIDLA
ncbi:hypothetical protein GQ44DRAFT_614761 [Phaeosphaeriaceae sp. PMI808]|nr:hypothetical protein GQ44DRAFT_614761 [Phaeosphaeriaceae sp. PMI808]